MSRLDYEVLRDRLELGAVAEHEGLQVWRRSRGLALVCPSCGKGDKHGSGARSRDGIRWGCVRCRVSGDVVDIIRYCRGTTASEAARLARELAGIDTQRAPTSWQPPKRQPLPSAPAEPSLDDMAERMRALRLAAIHYQYLAELTDGEDCPTAEEHIRFLVEQRAFQDRRAGRTDGPYRLPGLDSGIVAARAYLVERIGPGLDDSRAMVASLVGICPARDTGLRVWLKSFGGVALVDAGERAGLYRANGREYFAGRLVYLWSDEMGRVVYLTGRAVPALVVCGIPRDDKGEPIKGMALPSPTNNERQIGVPLPDWPFGAAAAQARFVAGDGVVIVEGEMDAIAGLRIGPTVATGGTGRMGSNRGVERLRAWLGSLPSVKPIVRFDIEEVPRKQAEVDRRAIELARAVGGRVDFDGRTG